MHEPGAWRSIQPSGGLAGGRPFHYAHRVSAGERWTDEAVLRESEHWVYVPPDATRLEDEQRLLVHLPRRWGQSRVWRSSVPEEERAGELIAVTIGAVRAAGGRLVWHTGEGISPPFMDECLVKRGFETTEELAVLAFSLVDGLEPRLPRLGVPEGVTAELAELLRSGQVHARELVDAALRRLEEREPCVNAFSFVEAERALAEAEEISPGDPRPFAGVPLVIKDGTPQEGLPMRIGSVHYEDHVADHDATTIRRLEKVGFVSIGRTTMPELGILPTTEPRLSGPTRNPWNLSRTPGGSSGGSAAAVAAGIVPLAHGGDGGGSLRIPAACCGLVGLKSSRGRISFAPDRGDDPLVTEGVLTRTVADTAALLDVLAGYEPGDATARYLVP